MLTAGDVLAKTLAKSQKVTFWSQKNSFKYFFFFLLTVENTLTSHHPFKLSWTFTINNKRNLLNFSIFYVMVGLIFL